MGFLAAQPKLFLLLVDHLQIHHVRTSATNVVSIFEDGFQQQPSLAHGAAFGSGIYFTECSSKADMYTSPAEHTEVRECDFRSEVWNLKVILMEF